MLLSRGWRRRAQTTAHIQFLDSGVAGKPTVRFSGVNVQIVNGQGTTSSANGEGNVVIGYDETAGEQTGSHNLLLGTNQSFTTFGSIVAGAENTASGPFSVVFGDENLASGKFSSVTGGVINKATAFESSVSGGIENRPRPDQSYRGSRVAVCPRSARSAESCRRGNHGLVSLIEELGGLEEGHSPYAKIQRATGTICAMAYRTARACMLVIAAGYVPEAFPLKRRITEAVLLVEHIVDDIYGTRATEWLEGRKPSLGKISAKKRAASSVLNRYSTGSHIDLRALPRETMVSTLSGERKKGMPLSGTREPELANHLLIEIAIEARRLGYDFAYYVLNRELGEGSSTRELFEPLERELDDLVPRLYPATIKQPTEGEE